MPARCKMARFMKLEDQSNDGYVDQEELRKELSIHDMRVWLSAQELILKYTDSFFDLTLGADGCISAQDLTSHLLLLHIRISKHETVVWPRK